MRSLLCVIRNLETDELEVQERLGKTGVTVTATRSENGANGQIEFLLREALHKAGKQKGGEAA